MEKSALELCFRDPQIVTSMTLHSCLSSKARAEIPEINQSGEHQFTNEKPKDQAKTGTGIHSAQHSTVAQRLDPFGSISEEIFEHVRVITAQSGGGPLGSPRRSREPKRPSLQGDFAETRMFDLHEVIAMGKLQIAGHRGAARYLSGWNLARLQPGFEFEPFEMMGPLRHNRIESFLICESHLEAREASIAR